MDPAALLGLFALINIFIGMFNLIPLLPFDGGHVAIALPTRSRRSGHAAPVLRRRHPALARHHPTASCSCSACSSCRASSAVVNPIGG
ncbi:MAG: site-2 protease family protein [Acidimicrobiales bacterium]